VTETAGSGRPRIPVPREEPPHPHTIDARDLNGDGFLDLVMTWGENRLTFRRRREGRFRAPGVPIEAGRKPYRNLRIADSTGTENPTSSFPTWPSADHDPFGDGRGNLGLSAPIPATLPVLRRGGHQRRRKPDIIVENYRDISRTERRR
jgi:hypothetical protein